MKNQVFVSLVCLMVGNLAQSLHAQSLGDVDTFPTSGIAGGPSLRHSHGMAYDHARNTVWVADAENGNDIFEFDATQADGTTLSPLTRLDVPVSAGSSIEGVGYDETDDTLWYVDRLGGGCAPYYQNWSSAWFVQYPFGY